MGVMTVTRSYQQQINLTVAGGGSPTWTVTATPAIQNIGFGSNDATFASTAVNNSATTDTIIVRVSCNNRNISAVTINGDAMTEAAESNATAGVANTSIWYRTGNIYTTPSIVASGPAGLQFCGIDVGVWTGASSVPGGTTGVLAYGYGADPQLASSVTIPVGGVGLAIGASETGANTPTWNNMTEDCSLASGSSWRHTSGNSVVAGALAVSVSGYPGAGFGIAVITLAP